MSYLRVNKTLCTGCRICESVCSLRKEGVLNKAKSRIRIYRRDILKLTHRVCVQCRRPPCLEACPEGAILRQDGKLRVDEGRCTGCGACIEVCDRLFLVPEGDRVVMCDQCGSCIPECPEGALTLREST